MHLMLATLIPLFDENMSVKAYSIFTQKANYLMNPIYLGTGFNDGAGHITGLEVINSMGIESLTTDSDIFVPVTNVSLFSDIAEQCEAPNERICLLIDKGVRPEDMYVNRIQELKSMGFKFAIRKLAVPDFEPYRSILNLMDYILLDHKKIVIDKAKIYFSKVYPDIKLIAAIPFPEFSNNWDEEWKKKYDRLLASADLVKVICPEYHDGVYQLRNQWMVNHCSRLIGIYNGQPGGTRNTINYARSAKLTVKCLRG